MDAIRNAMQKPIGGRLKIPKGGRSVLTFSALISMLKMGALSVDQKSGFFNAKNSDSPAVSGFFP